LSLVNEKDVLETVALPANWIVFTQKKFSEKVILVFQIFHVKFGVELVKIVENKFLLLTKV